MDDISDYLLSWFGIFSTVVIRIANLPVLWMIKKQNNLTMINQMVTVDCLISLLSIPILIISANDRPFSSVWYVCFYGEGACFFFKTKAPPLNRRRGQYVFFFFMRERGIFVFFVWRYIFNFIKVIKNDIKSISNIPCISYVCWEELEYQI